MISNGSMRSSMTAFGALAADGFPDGNTFAPPDKAESAAACKGKEPH